MTPTDTILALEKALEDQLKRLQEFAHDEVSVHVTRGQLRTLLDAHASALADSKRLDWLETQGYAYGFQDMHEGNRWTVEGPYSTVRKAIDSKLAALDDNTNGAAE